MLGFRELVILGLALAFFVGVFGIIGYVAWQVAKQRSAPAVRLARLDELRTSGKITATEYERQRASIISGV